MLCAATKITFLWIPETSGDERIVIGKLDGVGLKPIIYTY